MNIMRSRRTKDERGAEAVAMIFVIPFMIVLVLGLIDVGMMFRSRMLVENLARDTVRSAAADGGLSNQRTSTNEGEGSWKDWAMAQMYDTHTGCRLGTCQHGEKPSIACGYYTPDNNTTPYAVGGNVEEAGDTIKCTIDYPYKPINGPLLNSPLGLGIGSLLKPFHIEASARAETGKSSYFG